MAERREHPVAAFFVGLATLVLTGLLGIGAVAAFTGGFGMAADHNYPEAGVALTVLAVVVLVGGLWLARRVGTGRTRRQAAAGPVEQGRSWRVSEPGTNLTDLPGRGEVVVRLGPGTRVVEVDRQEGYILVTGPDGRTGWVDRRSVF